MLADGDSPGAELTVDLIHAKIMGYAEDLANQRYTSVVDEQAEAVYTPGQRFNAPPGQRKPRLGVASGKVFRYDAIRSKHGGLTLSLAENVDNIITDEQREQLWEVGAQAIEDALLEYEDMWITAVLQDALAGANYFKRFTEH